MCLHESTNRVGKPRYPTLLSTPSELGDILLQSWGHSKFLDSFLFLRIFKNFVEHHKGPFTVMCNQNHEFLTYSASRMHLVRNLP